MRFLFCLLCFWVVIMIWNVVYSFLPQKRQSITWVRVCAVVASIIILVGGIHQTVQAYRSHRFACVSRDGTVLQKKNFPWEITKTTDSDGAIVYIIQGRYGDSSEISVVPDRPVVTEVYNAINGVAVKFECPEEGIPNFKIEIGK